MTKYTFDHMHLVTADPEATAAWYERNLGAEILRSAPNGMKRIDMRIGGANIFLLNSAGNDKIGAGPVDRHRGLDHFGLRVDNLDAVAAELKAKSIEFVLEPVDFAPGLRICFIRGPEDVRIELLQRGDAR